MKRVIDQAVLLLYCLSVLWLKPMDTTFVTAFLAAVIYASMNFYMESAKVNLGITIIYLCTAVFLPNSILFLPLVFYGMMEYRRYVLAAGMCVLCLYSFSNNLELLCFLGIGCMISGIMQDRIRKYEALEYKMKRIRDDSTEMNLVLKKKNKTLLEKQDYEIYVATLKERNRIAREIHDNVGHMLSRAILMVGAARAVHGTGNLAESFQQLENTLNTAMDSIRESVHDLHDESVNMQDVLKSLTEEFTFCPVNLEYDMGHDVPKDVKYSFIAIVKEALHNVVKHSNARNVMITVREHPGLFQLIINDNGNADLEESGKKPKGIGISNMKERVESLGGTMQIQCQEGFCIYITVPKKEETL